MQQTNSIKGPSLNSDYKSLPKDRSLVLVLKPDPTIRGNWRCEKLKKAKNIEELINLLGKNSSLNTTLNGSSGQKEEHLELPREQIKALLEYYHKTNGQFKIKAIQSEILRFSTYAELSRITNGQSYPNEINLNDPILQKSKNVLEKEMEMVYKFPSLLLNTAYAVGKQLLKLIESENFDSKSLKFSHACYEKLVHDSIKKKFFQRIGTSVSVKLVDVLELDNHPLNRCESLKNQKKEIAKKMNKRSPLKALNLSTENSALTKTGSSLLHHVQSGKITRFKDPFKPVRGSPLRELIEYKKLDS